jgi:hypothetical protein
MSYEVEFASTLFCIAGKGGWTFAPVPEDLGPSTTEAWGRAPVVATVDGHTWRTSVWRERSGRVLLPVPKAVRKGKGGGDVVQVRLRYGHL